MPKCAGCGSFILFGGIKGPGGKYCKPQCVRRGDLAALEKEVPEDLAAHQAAEIHAGPCPLCRGPGPVDVYHSHFVWSAIVLTRWTSRRVIACRRCGRSRQWGETLGSALLGWWGFPFGLIITPIQVGRGVAAIIGAPNPAQPSAELHEIARKMIAAHAMANPLPAEPGSAPPTSPG